jgi:hypothetical protein
MIHGRSAVTAAAAVDATVASLTTYVARYFTDRQEEILPVLSSNICLGLSCSHFP